MGLARHALRWKHGLELPFFRLRHRGRPRFECPICGYRGPFRDNDAPTGLERHAGCPRCRSLVRHRLQFLVVRDLLVELDARALSMLHFAPEPFFRELFARRFGRYETADIEMRDVDHRVDLQALPFADESYDFAFASHVLEHVPDDARAIREIRRILRPGGVAVLPVPLVAERTIEYPAPNPSEDGHVRAPGYDYFERFERVFSRVDRIGSDSLPERYQLYLYEDRTHWPTPECPLRRPMPGERHADVVPVCWV